jgi:hypothetical protein
MKVQTAFRLDEKLLEMIKEKAKAQKRSLNNYIEYLLYCDIGDVPNNTTRKAINDAKNDIDLTIIDNLQAYKNTLIKDLI